MFCSVRYTIQRTIYQSPSLNSVSMYGFDTAIHASTEKRRLMELWNSQDVVGTKHAWLGFDDAANVEFTAMNGFSKNTKKRKEKKST